jgi:tetratricopeptide (TPR) repeat protein
MAAGLDGADELERGLVGAYLESGDLVQARALLDGILQRSPEDKDARASRAALRLATRDPAEIAAGVDELKALAEAEPRNARLHYQLARALHEAGRPAETRQELQRVLSLNNAHLGALSDLAAMALAEQDAGAALQYAEQALAIAPGNPALRLIRTAAWALQGRYSEVRPELTKLARAFPALPEVQIQLALLDLDQKNFDEAARRFRELYRPGSKDIRAAKGLASVYSARAQHEQALALVEGEMRLQPESQELLELYATTAERAGKLPEAVEAISRIERKDGANVEDTVRLAKLYHEQGEVGKATDLLEQAQKRAPGDAMIPALMGSLYSEAGDPDRAIASYRRGLELNPANLAVVNNLAYALAEQGSELEEALALASRAVRQSPGNPYCGDTLGFVYLKQGQLDSALQAFDGAVAKAPKVALFRVHRGMALAAQGDDDRAREELEAALALNPTGAESEIIETVLRQIDSGAVR